MQTYKHVVVFTCGAIAALFSGYIAAQTLSIQNANFEQSDGSGWAKGWERLQHAGEPAYRFTLDENKPFSGRYSGKIEQTTPQVFGLFKQRVDVRAYVGKRVSVRVNAKALKVGDGGGGLYTRVDGVSDAILSNDFESGVTRGTHDWKALRAVVEIPNNAVLLEFGIMLQDGGTIWADDFLVELTTDPVTKKPVVVNPDAITFDSIYKNQAEEEERRRGKALPKKP